MPIRKLGFLFLLLAFGAVVETTFSARHHLGLGPEGCRVIGGRFYGSYWSFDEATSRKVEPGAQVEIENSFGKVKVRAGAPGELRLGLHKVVYRPTREEAEAFAQRIHPVFEERGASLLVRTNRDELTGERRDVGFETHLDLELPPGTKLVTRNEHGAVDVRDVAEARIDSSFDSVVVEQVAGQADVTSRHGDVRVAFVGGGVVLSGRHGDVELEAVKGEARLDVEHGQVRVKGSGRLTAKVAHGRLQAEDVNGDLETDAEHAAIEISGVAGNARVKTSFDHLKVARVTGDAVLRAEHGRVEAYEIEGALEVVGTFESVRLESIGGPASVRVEHGGLSATDIRKGLNAEAEGDQVELRRIAGPVDVKVLRGSVELASAGSLVDPVRIRTEHGEIRLEVPADSRFELEATVRHGEVRVEVPELSVTRDGDTYRGQVGEGGIRIELNARHGDITITTATATASR